jgi:hypothetical protein
VGKSEQRVAEEGKEECRQEQPDRVRQSRVREGQPAEEPDQAEAQHQRTDAIRRVTPPFEQSGDEPHHADEQRQCCCSDGVIDRVARDDQRRSETTGYEHRRHENEPNDAFQTHSSVP